MNYEDVQKLSGAAAAKAKLLKNDFGKYFTRAVMAGFFIVAEMCIRDSLRRSLNWRISAGGIKEGLTIPHIYRSQIHLAYLRSVLFPFCGLVYLG